MSEATNHREQQARKSACFLCALDTHHCALEQLEGSILAAQERQVNGEKILLITLETGTFYADIELNTYYQSLIRGLHAPGIPLRKLRVRVYHLPSPANISEYKGRPRHYYQLNIYSLVVLEPDIILNITDLNQAEYCPRQYLLNRLTPSTTSPATIRGNLVHHCFKELLKEHGRGNWRTDDKKNGQDNPQAKLYRDFEQELENSSLDLALANVSAEEIRADVAPHLESLATWYQNQSATLWDLPAAYTNEENEEGEEQQQENLVRAETFLLAPEIGLRGRLDLLWKQSGRQRLLELKTGGAKGRLPRSEHQWQVRGYHALLTVRRDSKMKKALATLLYSGTPGEAQAYGIPFTVKELQRVNETRNILVLSHVTGIPPAPPGPSRCTKCSMLFQCQMVSSLLNWKPPEPLLNEGEAANTNTTPLNLAKEGIPLSDTDREFFARYYQLLQLEGRENEQQQALLWKTSVAERVARGTALSDLQLNGRAIQTEKGEWEQTFRCQNTSELREGDEILLSDGDPVTGEVVTGTIVGISAEEVKVWSPELISHPTLIDRYETSIVHVRTLQNLLRWLKAVCWVCLVVVGESRPRFNVTNISIAPRKDFNEEQNPAVERAMQMQDYLLIHGPPGTGKTSVIAEIVQRLCKQGQRVMLAAFTNQAVDNMLKRLDSEGFHEYVRLGHTRNVHADIQSHLLKTLVETKQHGSTSDIEQESSKTPTVREVLRTTSVVASTTATWSSEKYSPQLFGGDMHAGHAAFLQFDVAVIDEAGQLTIPAILGALRFAKRFILVGDEKQLPPLVLSKEAAEQGLADSLFSKLKTLDDHYRQEHPEAISACVPL